MKYVGEPGAIGRDQEVAVQRDLETPRHRDTVDRADERLGVGRQRAAERRAAGCAVVSNGVSNRPGIADG
jgi:hypothetical protein